MTYFFEYSVVGNSSQRVNIYRNNILVSTRYGGQSSDIVNFEMGDHFQQECLPASEFINSCDITYGTGCETNPNYYADIQIFSFYINVVFTFKTATTANNITSLSVAISDTNLPQHRTITVHGTTQASFPYTINEGSKVIASRTLYNGTDIFNIDNITYGAHTYCSNPSNICISFDVTQPKWDCVNNCSVAFAGGKYDTQAICQSGCAPTTIKCNTLAVDTWKPATTNPKTGANLAITVRSKELNKAFNIGYADAITLERHIIMSGVTDATGCFSGEIPAQADGVYNLTVCFLFLNISCPLTAPINPISITWGSKPLDLVTTILYGALGLGALYIIGQAIVKDRSNKLK